MKKLYFPVLLSFLSVLSMQCANEAAKLWLLDHEEVQHFAYATFPELKSMSDELEALSRQMDVFKEKYIQLHAFISLGKGTGHFASESAKACFTQALDEILALRIEIKQLAKKASILDSQREQIMENQKVEAVLREFQLAKAERNIWDRYSIFPDAHISDDFLSCVSAEYVWQFK